MKLRLEESDTVFQVDDIEPFPQTIADAILRMLAVAEAANPAIDRNEVLLEVDFMRRATERKRIASPAKREASPAFVPVGPVIVDVPSDGTGSRTFVVRDVDPNGGIVAMPASATVAPRSAIGDPMTEALPDGF